VAIRPEALTLTDPDAATLYGQIEDVEHLGSFSIVTVGRDDQRLRVITESGHAVDIDQRVGLRVASADLHLFDPATGLRMVAA
jgi:multiple sugar transport system ATP-binding protein